MIGKILRATRVQGLLRYLYGPGHSAEHRDPRIVAGFRSAAELEPPLGPDGSRDFQRLDGLLTQPLALLGERNYDKPVWHLPVRAAPQDPILTDQQWAEIATEMMERVGLAPAGDPDAVRWIAVRHADDHIHIVATLARPDGVRPEVWNDGYRVRNACRAVEERFGLRRTAPADRTAARRPKRGETEKAHRHGRNEPPRSILRRHVATAAAGARNETEFFARLQAEGVMVGKRFSQRDPDRVTGYAVALSDDLNGSRQLIWFGGGKLAADLTLPKLRHRWVPEGNPARDPRSADYRSITGRHLSARSARAVLRMAVRQAADRSRNPDDLFERLENEGFLVRRRFSQVDPGQLTGYAVALPDQVGHGGQRLWYGGGSLADDLSLPRLQRRWRQGGGSPGDFERTRADLTKDEQQALYEDAARAADYATSQIRRHIALAPHAARDACWAAADVLRVAAKATGNSHLRRAADTYDRAARNPYGRIPRPSSAGNELRTAARLLAMAGFFDPTTMAVIALVTSLAALLDTIDQLHRAQHRGAQAAATRSARAHLWRASPKCDTPSSHSGRTPSRADPLAGDFPVPWAPVGPPMSFDQDARATPTPQPAPAPRKPKPLRRRGPTV